MAMKRSGKFYRKNEAEIMRMLGLKPTKNSGSGWVEKEDGQSEDVICQLKSTDASSIKLNKQDLDTLSYNAAVTHKLPVFVVQFLQANEVYLVLKPEVLCQAAEYLKTGEYTDKYNDFLGVDLSEHETLAEKSKAKTVKSSSSAREQFRRSNENKFKKKEKSAI